jgi:hypothetical protein
MELQHMTDTDLTAQFVFTLAQASTRTVTLSWETRDGTAVENIDYVPASGQLVFQPGETSKSVTIQVLQPPTEERKFFTVAITDAVNATVDETEPGQVVIMPSNVFRGKRGFKGDRGQRGMSAYEEAVANGSFTGSYPDWLTYLSLLPLEQLANNTDPAKGAALVGYRGKNVAKALDRLQRSPHQNTHCRTVYAVLPSQFPDYLKILTDAGYTNETAWLGPGAFAVDEVAGEIFVAFGTSWQAFTAIAVFDLKTSAYKGYFKLVHATPEGIEVLYDYGVRKVFVSAADTGDLYEYNIPTTPLDGSMQTHVASHAMNMYTQFSYRNGIWMVDEASREIGGSLGRNVFGIYNKNFERIGTYYTDLHNSGYITYETNELAPYLNKRQGFALGDGFVVCSYGGAHDGDSPGTVASHQGTRILSADGQRIKESILNPEKFKALLTQSLGNNEHYTRVENEGVKVLSDGSIIALYIYKARFSPGSKDKDGIVLLKEYSNDASAFDYSSAATAQGQFRFKDFSGAIFPRSPDGIYNPATGAKFTTFDQICNYMLLSHQSVFGFYARNVSIKDFDGTALADGYYRISNVSGSVFIVEVFNPSASPMASWAITTTNGVRSKAPLSVGASMLTLASNYADESTKFGRMLGAHYKAAEERILALDIQSNASANTLVIGGGSSLFNGATSILFSTAATGDTLGGTVKWGIYDSTFRPAADNVYALGAVNARVSQVFAGTGTISTSCATKKTTVRGFSDAEIAASKELGKEVGFFKFLSAIEEKKNDPSKEAREHCGMTVQRAIEIFEAHGLDPFNYGIICYDKWEDQFVEHADEFDDAGELIRPAYSELVMAAGELYGFRENELYAFIARGLEARLTALEERQ